MIQQYKITIQSRMSHRLQVTNISYGIAELQIRYNTFRNYTRLFCLKNIIFVKDLYHLRNVNTKTLFSNKATLVKIQYTRITAER